MPSETISDYYIPNDNYFSIWVTSYCPGNSSSFIISSIKVIDYGFDKDTEPPTVPGNLQVTSIESTKISVKWDPSTDNIGVTGYEIYCNNALVGTTRDTKYTISNLMQCTNYKIEVRAYDAAGNYSPKASVDAQTPMPVDIVLQTPIILSNQPDKKYYAEATRSITLKPGFSVKANNSQEYLHARILLGCGRGVLSSFQIEENPYYIEEDEMFDTLYIVDNPSADEFQYLKDEETVIETSLGVLSTISDKEINIYPNPTTGTLSIVSEDMDIYTFELFDITGKNLLSLKPLNNVFTIDISTYSAGVYFIKIATHETIFMKKLFKM